MQSEGGPIQSRIDCVLAGEILALISLFLMALALLSSDQMHAHGDKVNAQAGKKKGKKGKTGGRASGTADGTPVRLKYLSFLVMSVPFCAVAIWLSCEVRSASRRARPKGRRRCAARRAQRRGTLQVVHVLSTYSCAFA